MEKIISDKVLRHRESNRRHYAKFIEIYREKHRQYATEHREQLRQYDKQHHEANCERYRKSAKEYQSTHPEERRKLYRERRARLHGVEGGHFTDYEWERLLDETGHKCLCCGTTDSLLCRDHVIPLGPPHSDEISNIQPLCRSCNSKKGAKTTDYRGRP